MKKIALALAAFAFVAPAAHAITCSQNLAPAGTCLTGVLEVKSGGQITVLSGGTLDVQGTFTQSGAGGLTLANSESINTDTDAVFDLTRNDAGTVTLTCSDDDATCAFTVRPGGAAAGTFGGASMTTFTVTTDGTGDGEVVLPTGSVSAGEILDLTRTISVPIFSMIECTTDAGALIGFDATADALPDFSCSATDGLGCSLTFDAVGGSVDTAKACGVFVVPADYASGGAFIFRATKSAETGANSEVINVQISNDGAALEAAGTATTSGTAAATYTVTPTIAGLAAGESVGFAVSVTSGGTADDAVNILSIGFTYTATQ